MSLVLVIVGLALVATGVMFACVNRATDHAGGSGLKSISVEGPAWLVLVVVGVASVGWGVVRLDDQAERAEKPPTTTEFFGEFVPYSYGDDFHLDGLMDSCLDFGEACDDLFFESPVDSDYEWVGGTCGLVYEDLEYAGICADQNP